MDKKTYRSELKDNENSNNNLLKHLEDGMLTKSTSTITMLSIFIAIVALFLTLVFQIENIDQYQRLLRVLILFSALTTILLMMFGIDILNTITNFFRPNEKKPYHYQMLFYRHIGPPFPKGGISYAYYGFATFTLFLFLSVAFFFPILVGFGLALYTYLGYPIFFGYHGKWSDNNIEIEVDETIKWPSIFLGLLFTGITIVFLMCKL